ncbi:hypothetical protein IID24_05300 [Patescibacteria group bacterium]|nr:hypothetical protein [Patescibacteria group bacterium]
MKLFTQKKLEEFDEIQKEWNKHYTMNTCSVCDSPKEHKDIKAFLSESIEQAYKEGVGETAIAIDKDMAKFLEGKSEMSVKLLNSVREQAREEERERMEDKVEEIRAELHNGKEPYNLVVKLLSSLNNKDQ